MHLHFKLFHWLGLSLAGLINDSCGVGGLKISGLGLYFIIMSGLAIKLKIHLSPGLTYR